MKEVIYFIKKNKKINIFNPYFIFSFIFLGVLFIYQLNWSQLTIPITSQLLLFLIVALRCTLPKYEGESFLFFKHLANRRKRIEKNSSISVYSNSWSK